VTVKLSVAPSEFHRRIVAHLAAQRQRHRREALRFAEEMGWTIISSRGKVLLKPSHRREKGLNERE